jgi:hypothetical protein
MGKRAGYPALTGQGHPCKPGTATNPSERKVGVAVEVALATPAVALWQWPATDRLGAHVGRPATEDGCADDGPGAGPVAQVGELPLGAIAVDLSVRNSVRCREPFFSTGTMVK